MQTEWQGRPELAELLPAGTFCFFQHRKGTQLGVRADDETRGPNVKGLVSLSTGYEAPGKQPAFFDLSVLRSTSIVYAIPSASIVLPTDRSQIHLGTSGIEDPVPGVLMQLSNLLFLSIAFNEGMRFLNLNDGNILKDWPPTEHAVWFSAWNVIWRQSDEFRNLWDFKLDFGAHPS
jgi:hypothetical protein